MLVLTRKSGEKVLIGDHVVVTVVEVDRGQVKLGISAPEDTLIHREEIYQKIMEENRRAAEVARDIDLRWAGKPDAD
ncbi:MAG: hypothetical protein Kow00128_00290 [Deltaproteobacteria bacterium]